MSVKLNLSQLKKLIPKHVQLVAVSKTKPIPDLMEAYNLGQRIFGENKAQEMVDKYNQMPKDIQWHMIGHLQRNKVKHLVKFVSLIHSVDSLKLLEEINKQATKHNKIIACLLQIKIAKEDSKYGMNAQEAKILLTSNKLSNLKYIKIVGLMGMATFTDDSAVLESEYKFLKSTFDNLKQFETYNLKLNTLSMGMSGDYQIAIKCGSTMIRVGSNIFGARNNS